MAEQASRDRAFVRAENKEEREKLLDFPDTIGNCVAAVMRSTANMAIMNKALDEYLSRMTPDERVAQREKLRLQLIDGRRAMESILNRLLVSVG